jgi:hypothetical protein
MSENEAHTGRLVEIEMYDHMDIESYLKHIYMDEKGITDLNYCDNWTDYATMEAEEYIVHDDKLYKIKDHMYIDNDCIATRNKDGSISFAVQFYNGGYSFEEAIEEALDSLIKKENKYD